MRISLLIIATLLLAACASSGDKDGVRKETAIADFIEVNELEAVSGIRTMDQLETKHVSETFVIVSTRRQDFLLEYYSRCTRRFDGQVEPDYRQDSRALYPRIDTFRGCRIKEIYAIDPSQAQEIRELGRSVGGGR